MITSDETEETLTKSFERLKRTLPDETFYSTIDEPLILVVDKLRRASSKNQKGMAESNALILQFPHSTTNLRLDTWERACNFQRWHSYYNETF